MAGTEEAGYPFWSPDSRSIGFFSQGKVKKIGLDGSPSQILCDEPRGTPRGGTWNRDGIILFSGGPTIYRVSASGGPPTAIVENVDDGIVEYYWPFFLPDGRNFLYLRRKSTGDSIEFFIVAGSLDSDETTLLVQARSNAIYTRPGYLLYAREGTLLAQPFDAKRLQLQGEPIPIADGLTNQAGMGHWGFWASDTGVLSYSPGNEFSYLPTWFDRTGQKLDSVGDPDFDCFDQSLSPDETAVALTCYDPQLGASDIRLVDLQRNVSSRLTSDPDWDQWPVWSPDSKRLAFWSMTELRERALDGMNEHKVLMRLAHSPLKPMDWSPNGAFILYQTHERGIHSDLMLVPTTGSGQPESYLATRFSEMEGRFSPDGKWVAYASDESGRFEVYVRSFPDGNQRYQISNDGGRRPYWRGDGKEIFYIDAENYVIAAPIEMTPTFKIGKEQKLFETAFPIPDESRYSVSADGQRFLLYSPTGRAAMTVVLNWTAELER